jgi:hypothetical protein
MHMPFMPDCRETSRLVSESMDHRLPFFKRLMIRLHLRMCKYCHRFEQHLVHMRAISRHVNRHIETLDPNVSLSPEARERIRAAVHAHSTGT